MDDEKTTSLNTLIQNLAISFFEIINDVSHLAKLEAKLAGKSLVNLVILFFMASILLVSLWLSVMAFVFIGLISFHFDNFGFQYYFQL